MANLAHTTHVFGDFGSGRWVAAMLLAACSVIATSAQAQANRTWVSGMGDDANPCSRDAPCKTFAGAMSRTAMGGEIDALDSAGFGTVTTTKSIMIDGGTGNVASILANGTTGVNINAGATDTVILRNLQINGMLDGASPSSRGRYGIRIIQAGKVVIDNVKINGVTVAGVEVASTIAGKVVVMVNNSQFYANTKLSTDPTPAAAISNQDAAHGSVMYVSGSTLFGNDVAFRAASGAKIISFNNNLLEGNDASSSPTDTLYER